MIQNRDNFFPSRMKALEIDQIQRGLTHWSSNDPEKNLYTPYQPRTCYSPAAHHSVCRSWCLDGEDLMNIVGNWTRAFGTVRCSTIELHSPRILVGLEPTHSVVYADALPLSYIRKGLQGPVVFFMCGWRIAPTHTRLPMFQLYFMNYF